MNIQTILKVFHHVDILLITIYLLMCRSKKTLKPVWDGKWDAKTGMKPAMSCLCHTLPLQKKYAYSLSLCKHENLC